jgi:uncharacterized protein (DUF885 family)
MRSSCCFRTIIFLVLSAALLHACSGPPVGSSQPEAGSGDGRFDAVAHEYLEDLYRRHPTQATYLGIHKYDDRLEDYSRQAVTEATASARRFRDRVSAIEPASLSAGRQLDREQLLHAIDSRLLTLEVVRPWARDADTYSSGLTSTRIHHDQDQARVRARRGAAA